MRFFRPAMAALVIGVAAPLLLVAPGFAQTCECPPADLSSGPVIEFRRTAPAPARLRSTADAGAGLLLDARLLGLE